MITDAVINTVDSLIACCGDNFCMMAAPDNAIYKVNDSVIFGATGSFLPNEDICSPIKGYMNDRLTLSKADDLVVQYYVDNLVTAMLAPRNYYITGRDNNGNFCIIRLWLNKDRKKIDRIILAPTIESNKACVLAMPSSLNNQETVEKYNTELTDVVANAETMPDLYFSCSKLLNEIRGASVTRSARFNIKFESII